MTCPSCGCDTAYVGTLFVECPNKECTFFSKRQLDEVMENILEELDEILDDVVSDPDKTPTYPILFSD